MHEDGLSEGGLGAHEVVLSEGGVQEFSTMRCIVRVHEEYMRTVCLRRA